MILAALGAFVESVKFWAGVSALGAAVLFVILEALWELFA